MNAKVIAVFCLLGGLLCGFKLGYQAGQGSGIIPVTETAPAKVRPRESVLSRPAADRSTVRAASVNQIAERVRRALGNSGSDLRFAGIIAALMGVTPDQIPVLAELLRKEINGRSGYIVTYALMPMWAEQDPAASLAFALSLDNSNRRRTVPGVLAGWARNNLAAALAHVQSQPKGSMRSEIARAILSEMATIDPQGAIAFIKQEGINSHSSNGTLASVFSNWVGKDPAFAAAAALELSSSKDRSCAIRSVVDAWARQDPNAAYHFVQSLSNVTEQAMAIITAIGSMVGNDPHRAAQLALEVKGSKQREAIRTVAYKWADKDLNDALVWVRSLPEGRSKQEVMATLSSRWARADPVAAAEFTSQMSPGSARDRYIGSVATAWGRQDSEAALAWVHDLPSSSSKMRAMSGILSEMAADKPEEAAKWIKEFPSSPSLKNLYGDIARGWIEKDPAAVREWAKSLPPSEGKQRALSEIVRVAVQEDPAEAARFVDGFSGAIQQELIGSLVSAWTRNDPVATMEWIKDPACQCQSGASLPQTVQLLGAY